MVRGDVVDPAVRERGTEHLCVSPAADGWVDTCHSPGRGINVAIEEQVMWRHLARQVHASVAPPLDRLQTCRARKMQDVAARAGFEQEPATTLDRGDFCSGRPCLEMCERVRSARLAQRALLAFDDLAVLGMEGDAQPAIARDRERLSQSVVVRSAKIARGRSHEHFQPDNEPRADEFPGRFGRLADQPEDAEVAHRRSRREGELGLGPSDGVGGRNGVGHVQDHRHAPATAAREPVSHVSSCSRPGSRKWTWASITPGRTCKPAASYSAAAVPGAIDSAISAMRPSTIATSTRRRPLDVTSVPLRIRRSKVTIGSVIERARADPVLGFYGPDSMMWKINREAVLLGAGPAALLLQIAHPLVARGVAEHSTFEQDPISRLRGTLVTTMDLIFGDGLRAEAAVRRLNSVHAGVRGESYRALDPELLLWVQVTLIKSSVEAYSRWVRPLEREEIEQFWQEGRVVGTRLGIPLTLSPQTWSDLTDYWEHMLADDGPIHATSTAQPAVTHDPASATAVVAGRRHRSARAARAGARPRAVAGRVRHPVGCRARTAGARFERGRPGLDARHARAATMDAAGSCRLPSNCGSGRQYRAAAVYAQDRSGHVARIVAEQEADRRSNLCGGAHATKRHIGPVTRGEARWIKRRVDGAGRDHVRANAGWRTDQRDRAHEAFEAGLGSAYAGDFRSLQRRRESARRRRWNHALLRAQ